MKNELIKLANIPYAVMTVYNTKIYAIHKSVNDEARSTYVITYKEYGLLVVSMSNKTLAIKLCCELNSKFKYPLNYKEGVKSFIIHFMNANKVKFFDLKTHNY